MEKIILAIALTIFTLGGNQHLYGQTEQSKEPKMVVEEFFKAFSEGNFEDAMVAFFKTNPWVGKNQDMMDSLKPKYASLPSVAGKYISAKVIKSENGENVSRIKVAAYFDRQPILFTFLFYKSGGVWRGQNLDVNFDDAFNEILKSETK